MKQSKIGKYYEAILQLRNIGKEVIDFVEEDTNKQSLKGIYIAKKIKAKNGLDYYFSSKRYAQTLGKNLVENFGGILKTSPRLFGLKDGKKTYRLTVFFCGIGFRKGDIIRFDNKIVEIKKTGKNITGVDIKNLTRISISSKDISSKKSERLEIKKAIVSKRYPQLEVIHPETYQSVKVENPKKTIKDKIDVVIVEEKVYML